MLVAVAAAMCSSSALAQNVNLPAAGTLSTEVLFNPFNNGDQFELNKGVKLRYFLTDQDAVRLTVGLDMSNKNRPDQVTTPGANATSYEKAWAAFQQENNEKKTKTGYFSLDLGYERHLVKSGRLDLYAGAQVGIKMAWYKETGVQCNPEYQSGDPDEASSYKFTTIESEQTGGDNAYFQIGAGVFTGLDFYLYKGLYIGTELGLNFQNKSYKDIETTVGGDKVTTPNDNSDTTLKFEIEPSLRLGWTF